MKFPGQYRELTINIPSGQSSVKKIESIFKDTHMQLYGFVEELPPKIINIRVNAVGRVKRPPIASGKRGKQGCSNAIKTKRKVFFHEEGDYISVPIYDGQRIIPGNKLKGPAVIELPTTTIVIRPDQTVLMDEFYNFNITGSF